MKGCRAFTDAEARELEGELRRGPHGVRDACLFVLGTNMGPRVSELLQLKLADVMQDGEVRADVVLWRRYRKGHGDPRQRPESMQLPVSPTAVKAIRAQVLALAEAGWTGKDDFLFQADTRQERKAICAKTAWRLIRSAAGRCGMTGKLGTHCMRKTFAQRVFKTAVDMHKGGDPLDPLTETMDALGHKDPKNTILYLGLRGIRTREVILRAMR